MQTSRFHTGLLVTLALGLGFSLASSRAIGYPAGAAVSTGSNPVLSAAGRLSLGSSSSVTGLIGATADHDLVVTDIALGLAQTSNGCEANGVAYLQDSSGTVYGAFMVANTTLSVSQPIQSTFGAQSGIRVPAGTTLDLVWEWTYRDCGTSSYYMAYTVAGYLAEP